MKKRKKLSVCIAVYNEEKNIEECIRSINDISDEIIVGHDGPCKDKTLEIAKKYTPKVYEFPDWKNGEPIKALTFEKASGDFILVIDADERISPYSKEKINKILKDKKSLDAYYFQWPIFQNKKNIESNTRKRKPVLFKKRLMYKIGLPHFKPETRGKISSDNELVLEHHTKSSSNKGLFLENLKKDKKRAKKYAKILVFNYNKIPCFNCNLKDKNLGQMKKLKLQKNWPLISIFILPIYNFINMYILRGYILEGKKGIINAIGVPIFYFITGFYIFKYKIKKGFKNF